MIKGVIFDFNGTLFWDTPFHNQSWDKFLQNHQIQLSDEEKNNKIHGKNNSDIFQDIFNRTFNEEELVELINEKEAIYRTICLNAKLPLAPGAIELFELLKDLAIPYTIATASGKENVLFFFEQFGLAKWFDFDLVVYDDGILHGKPNPDYFLKAMTKLKVEPKECLIFEDSYSGIAAAENAHAGKIIIVDSINGNYNQFLHQIITHFEQVDHNIF